MCQRIFTVCVLAYALGNGIPIMTAQAADKQSGETESEIFARFPDSVIPIWAVKQSAPYVTVDDQGMFATSADTMSCPPSFELSLPYQSIALRFDSARGTTELYNKDGAFPQFIRRYDIDAELGTSSVLIPLSASPYLAVDLDLDGNVELILQGGTGFRIHSAPDWVERAAFLWSGYNVVSNPTLVELDGDPYPEIFATPNTLGLNGRIVVIDYDPVADSFVKIVDYIAQEGAYGQPAVGDFDEDGRMEIISGADLLGYHLYEWQESTLVDIGFVGDTNLGGGCNSAVACRPLPNGKLHALLGYSYNQEGFKYLLLEPTGDNTFAKVTDFRDYSSATGIHPCWAADTDCDGMDELTMGFYPGPDEQWEWDQDQAIFVKICEWDWNTYGTLIRWYSVDLDQNGATEIASVSHLEQFYAFPDPDCIYCDSLGQCPPKLCFCDCHGDPQCDSVVNVFDVVSAVDVAFRSGPDIPDPLIQCPHMTTDVTCDLLSNVFDVVALVDVAFRNADPATAFCDPCGHGPGQLGR